jgi:hypothetical protein
MKSKGLSQVLSVIVAASVLMMLGLTLTIMTQGSLTDLFGDSQMSSCVQTVNTQCSVTNEPDIDTPNSCIRANADSDQTIDEILPNGGSENTANCPSS